MKLVVDARYNGEARVRREAYARLTYTRDRMVLIFVNASFHWLLFREEYCFLTKPSGVLVRVLPGVLSRDMYPLHFICGVGRSKIDVEVTDYTDCAVRRCSQVK